MFSIVHNLNLIIGPLITKDSEHWQLYLLLKEIIINISSDRLHSSTYQLLETLIDEYLSLFVCRTPFCCPLSTLLKGVSHYTNTVLSAEHIK